MSLLLAAESLEVWERHYKHPHQGSSLGRIRTGDGRVIAQRPSNRGYFLADLCGLPGRKKPKTVSVHRFITECHWGPAPSPRHHARHVPGAPRDGRWCNLLGWGTQSDNEHDKPEEVRRAAAHKAFAARTGYLPSRPEPQRGWASRLVATLSSRSSGAPVNRPVTNAQRMTGKPITESKLGHVRDRYHAGFDSVELTCDDRCHAA